MQKYFHIFESIIDSQGQNGVIRKEFERPQKIEVEHRIIKDREKIKIRYWSDLLLLFDPFMEMDNTFFKNSKQERQEQQQ